LLNKAAITTGDTTNIR